ncbi:MAG: hypothetical protein EBS69_10495, partial [Verrucomicrobia bacterium]|nr:hypothetical protein [Verrucomicrobiota bacterium]
PASPKDPDGSRADIGYSSARALSGSNWVNALPSFTNNAFTGGNLDQWEVDGGGTRTVQNDANATDGKSAYIYELAVGVKLRSPAFVCGEGWRARARYRNPSGLSSCGFVVYDAGNNNALLASNLEDDGYATKEYDLSRFAGQTIKVGVSGGNVVVDFVEVLAPVVSSQATAPSFPSTNEWTLRWTNSGSAWYPFWQLRFRSGNFLAGGVYSSNGTNWNAFTLPNNINNWLNNSGVGDGVFILNGAGNDLWNSTNGASWTKRSNSGGYDDLTGIEYGNGTFVVNRYWSPGSLLVSKDSGNTWSYIDTGDFTKAPGTDERHYESTVFGQGVGVFLFPLFDSVRTSSDGLTWQTTFVSNRPS